MTLNDKFLKHLSMTMLEINHTKFLYSSLIQRKFDMYVFKYFIHMILLFSNIDRCFPVLLFSYVLELIFVLITFLAWTVDMHSSYTDERHICSM